ncbi:MAG: hypothetical protein JSW27_04235 [Phycisphaerales bacterium]|nr:MAG: hypothetical protein JSW27_04235 [Phycisphaerales bacterium]
MGGTEESFYHFRSRVYDRDPARIGSFSWIAKNWLLGETTHLWGRVRIVAALYGNGVLLWPAFREIAETGLVPAFDEDGHLTESPLSTENYRRARMKEIDFWMF